MSEPVAISPESVEAIAQRVAELMSDVPRGAELIDAQEVADRFNVSRDFIYSHSDKLGVVRLGTGPRARLRFDPERVLEALAPRPFSPAEPTRTRPQPRHRTNVELLEIK